MARDVGRPVEYTPERIQEIKEAMERYIDENSVPIVAEFAYLNDIRRQKLYEIPELSDTLGKLIDKKEAQLEKGGLSNALNASMAKFSLAQLGWSEKQETKVSGDIPVSISAKIEEIRAKYNDKK
jgi:hypothetical protein